jgi:hypothetical protein
LFSAVMRAGDENEYEDGNRPFHSADMIVHCWTELMSTAPKGCAPTRYRGWY